MESNIVYSNVKPEEIDHESSKVYTYINKDIEEIQSDDEAVCYKFTQETYTKEEYNLLQFKNINNVLDNYVDIDSLTLDETKQYMVSKMGEICSKVIYSGIDVTLLNGQVEHFSLTLNDQANIHSHLTNIFSLGLKKIAYHADGCNCKMYDYLDFLRIGLCTEKHVIEQLTYCNFLNNYIRGMESKEEILSVTYGMDLPEELTEEMTNVITEQTIELVTAIKEKFGDIVIEG